MQPVVKLQPTELQPVKQRALFALLAAAALSTACQSWPWSDDAPTVDDAYLVNIPEDQRQQIVDLRVQRAQLTDELAAAERRVDLARKREKVASEELDVAQQEVAVFEARAGAAREDPDAQAAQHDESLAHAQAHVEWARAQTELADAGVALARAERKLAERRTDVVEAQLELRKARAVDDLEDDRVPDLEINRYVEAVDAAETRVAMAEIDVQAAHRRTQAQEDRMEKIAARVPSSETEAWRRIVPARDDARIRAREAGAPRDGDGDGFQNEQDPFDQQPSDEQQ